MHYIIIFTVLTACVLADDKDHYSFSPAVGGGGGTSFSVTGEDRITAIRVWEIFSKYIYGFQIRYGATWSPLVGHTSGDPKEIELFEKERIIQISGKHNNYIQSIVFVTNLGRSLQAGEPSGHSFNMYPAHRDAELRFVSGRVSGAPTSIEAHWAIFGGHSGAEMSNGEE